MVKKIMILVLFFFPLYPLFATDSYMFASIDEEQSQAHFPIIGLLMITHDSDKPIDENSFQLKGQKLDVSFVKETKLSAGQGAFLSIYSFQLPAREQGVYTLPPITAKIGNQTITSLAASYSVHEAQSATTPISSELIFTLEASVDGPTTLFIGERTKFVYHILYNKNIDLSASNLPLIHPAHFQKIGDVQITDQQTGEITIQTLSQEVEASEVGIFTFGPSSVEGYSYHIENNRKVYDSHLLKAQAKPITLTILKPGKEKEPPSFTGAIGNINAEVKVLPEQPVHLGDTLHLILKISGVEDLEAFTLPSLSCQVGFSGFFELSPLPPLEEIRGNTKILDISLRPINPYVYEIPSIQLSSFNSQKGEYVIVNTPAQPINLIPSNNNIEGSSLLPPLLKLKEENVLWPQPELQ